MNRRDILTAAGAAMAGVLVSPAFAADDHAHHGHDHAAANPHAKLAETALDCVKTGDACLAHCFQSFQAGDLTLAACAQKVDELLAVCRALAKLAANGSPQLAAYAKVAQLVCRDCEKECRKHADKHATCKACAESCAACAEQCGKLI